jgi:hypothetical protein
MTGSKPPKKQVKEDLLEIECVAPDADDAIYDEVSDLLDDMCTDEETPSPAPHPKAPGKTIPAAPQLPAHTRPPQRRTPSASPRHTAGPVQKSATPRQQPPPATSLPPTAANRRLAIAGNDKKGNGRQMIPRAGLWITAILGLALLLAASLYLPRHFDDPEPSSAGAPVRFRIANGPEASGDGSRPQTDPDHRPPPPPAAKKPAAQTADSRTVKSVVIYSSPEEKKAEPSPTSVATRASRETPPDRAAVEKQVRTFLSHWKNAWEKSAGPKGSPALFNACYADTFKGGGAQRTAWLRDKATKNRKKAWIRIELSRVHIHIGTDGNSARVSFSQRYRSSNYADDSIKTLQLVRPGRHWQIQSVHSSD